MTIVAQPKLVDVRHLPATASLTLWCRPLSVHQWVGGAGHPSEAQYLNTVQQYSYTLYKLSSLNFHFMACQMRVVEKKDKSTPVFVAGVWTTLSSYWSALLVARLGKKSTKPASLYWGIFKWMFGRHWSSHYILLQTEGDCIQNCSCIIFARSPPWHSWAVKVRKQATHFTLDTRPN